MKKLLILTESPFSRRDYDRFGVQYLQTKFEVTILDCTALINPHVWELSSSLIYQCHGYLSIRSQREFKEHVLHYKYHIVIDYLSLNRSAEIIRKQLRNQGALLAIVQNGLLPNLSIKTNIIERCAKILSFTIRRLLRLGYERVFGRLRKVDIVLLGGEAGLDHHYVQAARYKVLAHSFDYDIYLKLQTASVNRNRSITPYAVFLDEDMVNHSDYFHLGLCSPITEEQYYSVLNNFFDWVERVMGLNVIIAAHPRSRYDLKPQLLGGRSYYIDKTAELVRDASLVFLHASTARSYPVLWKKPMVFLTANELLSSYIGEFIKKGAELFNKVPINMSEHEYRSIKTDEWFMVNDALYEEYCRNFIKIPNSLDMPIWELFVDFLNKNGL